MNSQAHKLNISALSYPLSDSDFLLLKRQAQEQVRLVREKHPNITNQLTADELLNLNLDLIQSIHQVKHLFPDLKIV